MIHKIPIHTGLLKRCALLTSLFLCALALAACYKPAEEASEELGQSERAIAIEQNAEDEVINTREEIKMGLDSMNSLIDLYLLKQSLYTEEVSLSADMEQTINKKWSEIENRVFQREINDSINLIDYRYEHLRGDIFRFSLLFKVIHDIDKDYGITVFAEADPIHTDKQVRPTILNWSLPKLEKPTSSWKAGTYELIGKEVKAMPIPYSVSIAFRELRPDGQFESKSWDKVVGLGWVADIDGDLK